MEILKSISSWMGGGFGVFVYFAIVILFFIGITKCILPVIRTTKLLNRAVKNIKKGDKAKRSWQEDKFLGRGALMAHWSDYLNNLFFADGEYHNPSNVEDYINEDTVIDGPGSTHLADAIPGVAVSLGFLGTLMGLSVALSGMSGANTQAVIDSMSTLLSSMKYAFVTSIFGVVVSILFTLLTKVVRSRAERALISFYNAMARYAGVLSVDPMTQIAIYQQEQTSLLKALLEATDSERTAKMLTEAVKASIQPLAAAVEKNMDITSRQQAALMNSVAEAYVRKMDEAVHGQFDHLAQTIENTCRYQEKSVRMVSDAMNNFAEASRAVKEIRRDTEELLKRMESLVAHIAQQQGRYEDVQAQVLSTVNTQTDYMQMLAGVNEEFARQADVLKEGTTAFMENVNRLNRANVNAMNEGARAIADAGESLAAKMLGAREKLSRDMDESLNYFEGCMTEILKRIEWAATATKSSVDGLPDAVEEAAGCYLNEIRLLTDALKETRRKISEAGKGIE